MLTEVEEVLPCLAVGDVVRLRRDFCYLGDVFEARSKMTVISADETHADLQSKDGKVLLDVGRNAIRLLAPMLSTCRLRQPYWDVSPELGDYVASLGDEVIERLGEGDDGEAYLLASGRVLKTTNALEAAISLRLKTLASSNAPLPGTPAVHSVGCLECVPPSRPSHVVYVVIRDALDDLDWTDTGAPVPGRHQAALRRIIAALEHAGIWVSDVFSADNLGLTADGCLAIRDFSKGAISPAITAAFDEHMELSATRHYGRRSWPTRPGTS